MRDDPAGAALIAAARQALTEEVLPGLTGRPRYVALMVANALGIAIREIGEAESLAESAQGVLAGSGPSGDPLAGLVAAIRGGRRDADPELHAALLARADAAARVSKPKGP